MGILDTIVKGKAHVPPRIVIYGYEGIGKSCWAAQAPKPIFIQTEDGLNQINCAKFPLAQSFQEVMAELDALLTESHDYQTVVVDSLSALGVLIDTEICKKYGVKNIEQADGGYGKGFSYGVTNFWLPFEAKLNRLVYERGMMVILTAHVGTITIKEGENLPYDRTVPRLNKCAVAAITQWSDCVFLAKQKSRISEKNGHTIASPVGAAGGDRVIRTIGSVGVICKNRYALPEEMPLDFNVFLNAVLAYEKEEKNEQMQRKN